MLPTTSSSLVLQAGKSMQVGKEHQSEIATPRQNLVARRHDLQTNLDNIGHTLEHVEALMGYCARVLQQLQTVDPTGKR